MLMPGMCAQAEPQALESLLPGRAQGPLLSNLNVPLGFCKPDRSPGLFKTPTGQGDLETERAQDQDFPKED